MTQIVQARPMAARLDSPADLVGSFPKYSIQARRMDPTPSPRGEDVGNRTVAVFCEIFSLTPFVVGERDNRGAVQRDQASLRELGIVDGDESRRPVEVITVQVQNLAHARSRDGQQAKDSVVGSRQKARD